jgi:PRTRC genetic system protein E
MFKELVPILRQRAVLLTVTLLEDDQIRVNIVPKKIKDGDNAALTTPLSVTGTAEELDAELSSTIVGYVGSHLQLKNTLEKAKAEMDEAAKTAQAEARSKSKVQPKKEPVKTEAAGQAPEPAKTSEPTKPEPPRTAGLFDAVVVVAPPFPTEVCSSATDPDEEDDIMAEIENEQQAEEDEAA